MKQWLAKVRPPKFLRYLFFVTYGFYRRFTSERSNANFKAIAFLSMFTGLAYEGVFFYVTKLIDRKYVLMIMIFVFVQFYFWFWHREKWKLYVEEFKHINRRKQLWGGVYLFIYLFICLLPIAIPAFLSLAYDINVYK